MYAFIYANYEFAIHEGKDVGTNETEPVRYYISCCTRLPECGRFGQLSEDDLYVLGRTAGAIRSAVFLFTA